MTVRVPAKVNLQLSVGPRRPDGYHDVVTVLHSISIFDEVVAVEAGGSNGISIAVDGEAPPGLPLDESNLAWRAAQALAEYADFAPDVHLLLRKRIPIAGGMAGGSADAAAALIACDALWGTDLGREEMALLAARLGSDVPFSLHGGTAVGTNRGEILTPALISGQFHWVCAFVSDGLSAAAVYAECDRLRGSDPVRSPQVSEPLMAALRSGDARAVGRQLTNGLERAAVSLRPQLDLLLEAGRDAGALGAIVSGSGPTCVFLARDEEHALDLAAEVAGSGQCESVAQASGPVHGARIVEVESGVAGL